MPLNQAAVSKSPSSILKGGTHPNSRLIFEQSTVNDPVKRLTAPLFPVSFPRIFISDTGNGNNRAGTTGSTPAMRTVGDSNSRMAPRTLKPYDNNRRQRKWPTKPEAPVIKKDLLHTIQPQAAHLCNFLKMCISAKQRHIVKDCYSCNSYIDRWHSNSFCSQVAVQRSR